MRRYMMKIAEKIARANNCQALITGESIGQVASQTISALGVTDNAVSMPVFRPVIGMDKDEIVVYARKIDTFETSILPYEDCCTVFAPKHPKLKPNLEEILEAEHSMNMDELIDNAIQLTITEEIRTS
jgi:thiamine biosynthesis protein ThiI